MYSVEVLLIVVITGCVHLVYLVVWDLSNCIIVQHKYVKSCFPIPIRKNCKQFLHSEFGVFQESLVLLHTEKTV